MSPDVFTFEIPGPIRGKGRPRFVRATGRTYTPADTMNAEAWVKHCAVQAGAKPTCLPVRLWVTIAVAVPESWPRKKRDQALANAMKPTGKPDLDNIAKLIGDSLNGICWQDDKQIFEMTVQRHYAHVARTVVTVDPWQ